MARPRACGPCDLCCKLPVIDWPEFPDLRKPAGVYCRHRVEGRGCAIHPDRPIHCAAFQCLWLMGFGGDDLRPDRIGGFFDATDSGRLLLIWDRDRPDPRRLPAVRAFVQEWRRRRRGRLEVWRDGRKVR